MDRISEYKQLFALSPVASNIYGELLVNTYMKVYKFTGNLAKFRELIDQDLSNPDAEMRKCAQAINRILDTYARPN